MAAAKCRNRRRELTDTLQAVSLNATVLQIEIVNVTMYISVILFFF